MSERKGNAFADAVVTDHAVLRFLERVYGVDVELVRHEIAAATARGIELARIEGHTRFRITVERVCFAIVDGTVVTAYRRRDAARAGKRRRR